MTVSRETHRDLLLQAWRDLNLETSQRRCREAVQRYEDACLVYHMHLVQARNDIDELK